MGLVSGFRTALGSVRYFEFRPPRDSALPKSLCFNGQCAAAQTDVQSHSVGIEWFVLANASSVVTVSSTSELVWTIGSNHTHLCYLLKQFDDVADDEVELLDDEDDSDPLLAPEVPCLTVYSNNTSRWATLVGATSAVFQEHPMLALQSLFGLMLFLSMCHRQVVRKQTPLGMMRRGFVNARPQFTSLFSQPSPTDLINQLAGDASLSSIMVFSAKYSKTSCASYSTRVAIAHERIVTNIYLNN